MKKIHYYPGCTLKTTGTNFDISARSAALVLDLEMVELSRWICCGTVHSLASDDLIHHLAPVRNLIRARDEKAAVLTTLCSMCYNTLKRADLLLRNDREKRERINRFMEEETDYHGEVRVVHLLEILRNDVGFDRISEKSTRPLSALKLAPYSGCLLLRPREVALDDPEDPRLLADLITSTGAEAVDFPYKNECCGSYQTISNEPLIETRAVSIIDSARMAGAEALVTSCPLCQYNLELGQKRTACESRGGIDPLPVLYFTQILCIAFGLGADVCGFDMHLIDPRPLLKEKGYESEGRAQ